MSSKRKPTSLADSAYARIRRMVITCELPPGLQFSEHSMVERLKLGKTPVREALGRLVQDKLVRNVPRVGYVVTPVTLGEVAQLLEFRIVVEPAAARLAAGRSSTEKEVRLRQLVEVSPFENGAAFGVDEWTKLNREIHMTIAEWTQNDRLIRAVNEGLEEWERLYRLAIALGAESLIGRHDEHWRLAEAIFAGNAELAEEISRQHVLGNHGWTTNAFVASVSLKEAEVTLPGTNTPGRKV